MKKIKIEDIHQKDYFLNSKDLTKEELNKAIEEVIKQIDVNMEYVKNRFPYSATKDLKYPIIDCLEWTDGFWTGMLWLAYEYTKDEKYKELAMNNVEEFSNRIENKIEVSHHDLGFLYSPSCVSAYKLTGSEKAKNAAIKAADQLITRYHEKGEFIQAWGPLDSQEHYRFIIDCLLNIPLLYWATEITSDSKYKEIADKHFITSCKYVIRDDASAYHTYYMNIETGEPLKGGTRQGYSETSSWARGQAWGMYGLALNYKQNKEPWVKDLFVGMSNYFLNRLPNDLVSQWDLIFINDAKQARDSSATAIACCAINEMSKLTSLEEIQVYTKASDCMLRSLIENYTSNDHQQGDPVLYHGVYSWHSKKGVDEGNIWGDYFYLEALIRRLKQWNSYW